VTTIWIASRPGEADVAAVGADGSLLDYALWRPGAPDGVGDLHRGRVTALVPAMAGAFVALGEGTDGFLPDTARPEIALTVGDAVAVRIVRAAQGGKGPRLSARDLPPTEPEPPALLVRGPSPVDRFRALHQGARIIADDPSWAARAGHATVDRAGPPEDVRDQIDALAGPVLRLPTGAAISFHPTPALVAIDVDLGPATGARGVKAAVQREANRALIPALARQIRLRDLSGAILVDFAGLAQRARASLAPALDLALNGDPQHPRLLGFTRLGLAEIVRRRVRPPLHELRAGPHAAALRALAAAEAAGASRLAVASPLAAALEADGFARDDLARRTGRALMLRVDPALPLGWRLES
jgi:Ribonuclease G/E